MGGRAQVVDEANAIGTAYLRIDLLPAAVQPRLRGAFRSYTDARIATYKKLPDLIAASEELARSQQFAERDLVTGRLQALDCQTAGTGEMLMMPALNEMFDIATVRLMATQMHPPTIVLRDADRARARIGPARRLPERRRQGQVRNGLHKVGFAAIIAFTVYVIIDIEYPRLGWIRVDAIDQVLLNVRASMK
jgi:hypothetical protein